LYPLIKPLFKKLEKKGYQSKRQIHAAVELYKLGKFEKKYLHEFDFDRKKEFEWDEENLFEHIRHIREEALKS